MFKKKKIKKYLQDKNTTELLTAFDNLLNDYIQGKLTAKMKEVGISKVEIHIDWLPDYKCIEISGLYHQFIVDIQIESLEYTIAYDEDEADESVTYSLENADAFYKEIHDKISKY